MASRHGLAIRAVDGGDIDGVADLIRVTGLEIPRGSLGLRLEAMRTQPGVVLIAEEWGPVTGLIALTWSARFGSDLKIADVTYLLVDPDHRRRGVARLLLKAASQAARVAGCGELILNVGSANAELAGFALATGFAVTGNRLARPLRNQG